MATYANPEALVSPDGVSQHKNNRKFTRVVLLGSYWMACSVFAQNADGRLQKFNGWNVEYRLPEGWRVLQTLGRVQMLSSNGQTPMLAIAPGLYTQDQQALADLNVFLQFVGLTGYATEQPHQIQMVGMKTLKATYTLTDRYFRQMQGRFLCLYTPHGTGVNVLAVTTSDQFPKLCATVENLVATIKAQPPQADPRVVAALAGRWTYYSGGSTSNIANSGYSSRSYEETVFFDGRGNYQWQSSSHVSVDSPVTEGGYSSGASNFGGNQDHGTYTVIGTSLVMKGTAGQMVFDFVVQGGALIAAGKTYVRQ